MYYSQNLMSHYCSLIIKNATSLNGGSKKKSFFIKTIKLYFVIYICFLSYLTVSAAVYLGSDENSPLADISIMTYDGSGLNNFNGYDNDYPIGLLSNSLFFDNIKNSSAVYPVYSGSHWNDTLPLYGFWIMDLKDTYSIKKLTLHSGTGNGYYGMMKADIYVSNNGLNWFPIGNTQGVKNTSGTFPTGTTWTQNANIIGGLKARYIKINISDFLWAGSHKLDEIDLCIEASTSAEVFCGSDNTFPEIDISTMTYDGSGLNNFSGHDKDYPTGSLSNSLFFDNIKNSSTASPVYTGSHWDGTAPQYGDWIMDLKDVYCLKKLQLHSGSGNRYYGMHGTNISLSTNGVDWSQAGSSLGVKNSSGSFPIGTTWTNDISFQTGTLARYVKINAFDFSWAGSHKLDELSLYLRKLKSVSIDINLQQQLGKAIKPELYGANISSQMLSGWSGPYQNLNMSAFRSCMQTLNLPFLRVNMGGGINATFSDPANPDWTYIDTLLNNIPLFHTGKLLITLDSSFDVESAVSKTTFLDQIEQIILRFQAAELQVDYWEVFNEPEHKGESVYDDICFFFNDIAAKIGALESTPVGGPTLTWADTNKLERFFQLTGTNFDFITYHHYASIDINKSTGNIMNDTDSYKSVTELVSALMNTYIGQNNLPIAITEYNISGTWNPSDNRQSKIEGAIFTALSTSYMAEGGVSMATIWETFADGTFGIIDTNYNVLPSGWALSAMSRYMPGEMVYTELSDTTVPLRAITSLHNDGSYSVLLVNFSEVFDINTSINCNPCTYERYVLSNEYIQGNTQTGQTIQQAGIKKFYIPAMSIVILKFSP